MPELSEMFASPGPRWMRDPNADKPVEWFARGMQLTQQQQQIDQQSALLQLRQTLGQQEAQINSIKIANELRSRQEQIDAERAFAKVMSTASRYEQNGLGGSTEMQAAIHRILADNPAAALHPGMRDFQSRFEISVRQNELAEEKTQAQMDKLAATAELEKAKIEGRQTAVETKTEADIDRERIRAKAKVDAALVSASKWKDHSKFAAFKSASDAITKVINPATKPEEWAQAITEAYNQALPIGEQNAPSVEGVPATDQSMVNIISPDGKRSGKTSREKLDSALRQGWKLAPTP